MTASMIALRIGILPMDAASEWLVRQIRRYRRQNAYNNFSCQNKIGMQLWGMAFLNTVFAALQHY
jgi:hypothetical protein